MTQEAKTLTLIGIITLVILIGATFLVTKGSNTAAPLPTPVPSSETAILVRSDSHQTASSSAKVTVVEFGDYQCPACEAAYPMTKQMLQDFDSKINFVFRNFPLPQHQNAMIAAEAAEAAGAQGKFWQMHDKLYDTQNDWAESPQPLSFFDSYAKGLGLNLDQFNKDVTSNAFSNKIGQDMNDGETLGINVTPTFFVNGVEIAGVPSSYDDLKAQINADLAK